MKNKIQVLTDKLGDAFNRFEDVMKKPNDEFIRDSAIQRFEFTYELAWKTLKACLETKGIKVFSPMDATKEGFKIGLIPDDPAWIDMLKSRNLTTHIYKEALAEEVYSALPKYLELIRGLLKNLKEQGHAL